MQSFLLSTDSIIKAQIVGILANMLASLEKWFFVFTKQVLITGLPTSVSVLNKHI